MLELADAVGDLRPSLHIPPLADRVAGHIEQLILDGRIRPGSRIVEEALAKELAISRASLREAIISLEKSGLITRDGRSGRVIRTLNDRDVIELYELWTILESEAAAMACETADAAAHVLIGDVMAAMEQAGDKASYHRLNLEFHDALVAPCPNARLVETYRALIKQVRWAWALKISAAGEPEVSKREHREIAKAYRARDAARTRSLIRAHLSAGAERAAET